MKCSYFALLFVCSSVSKKIKLRFLGKLASFRGREQILMCTNDVLPGFYFRNNNITYKSNPNWLNSWL